MTRRRISPRLREQAAVACAQTASWWTSEDRQWEPTVDTADPDVTSLAYATFETTTLDLVRFALPYAEWREAYARRWAEAESLLRTGWSPCGWDP